VRLLYRTTIDDMVAVFLKAEIASERFGEKIISQLRLGSKERSVVDTPDITNVVENAYRRQLLASYRAYVFEELPAHTQWYRAVLNRDEVMKIRYIDYDYWNEISDNTRLPIVATETIRAGREIYGQSTQVFLDGAEKLRAGALFPELIVVGTSPEEQLTVYEGHGRLTCYMLAPECIPEALEVVAGFAPECVTI
jgi:DNA phosphorothioation-dependent restriction protein DptG